MRVKCKRCAALAVLPAGVPQTSQRIRSFSPVLNRPTKANRHGDCPLRNDRIKGVIHSAFDDHDTIVHLAPFVDVQDLDNSLSD
jgi:hypothetical protein